MKLAESINYGRSRLFRRCLLASLLLLTACGAPIDNDAVVIGTLLIRDQGEGSIALWQDPVFRAQVLCDESGSVVVRYLDETDGRIAISADTVEFEDSSWPHTVSIQVNGDDFELEDDGVFVTPYTSKGPDDASANMSDIELRGTSRDPALLDAIRESGWIQVRAMGAAYAAEFSEQELAPLIDTCERFAHASTSSPTRAEESLPELPQVGGSWVGEYREYSNAEGAEIAVPFRLELTSDGDTFSGRSSEGDAWMLRGGQPLTAQIKGTVEGARVRFAKRYNDENLRAGALVYEGVFSEDRQFISGTWQLPDRSGTFQMNRE
jgi:hypothetical protein